jgi:hypothetical protein
LLRASFLARYSPIKLISSRRHSLQYITPILEQALQGLQGSRYGAKDYCTPRRIDQRNLSLLLSLSGCCNEICDKVMAKDSQRCDNLSVKTTVLSIFEAVSDVDRMISLFVLEGEIVQQTISLRDTCNKRDSTRRER